MPLFLCPTLTRASLDPRVPSYYRVLPPFPLSFPSFPLHSIRPVPTVIPVQHRHPRPTPSSPPPPPSFPLPPSVIPAQAGIQADYQIQEVLPKPKVKMDSRLRGNDGVGRGLIHTTARVRTVPKPKPKPRFQLFPHLHVIPAPPCHSRPPPSFPRRRESILTFHQPPRCYTTHHSTQSPPSPEVSILV